jgi:hypothetical protein
MAYAHDEIVRPIGDGFSIAWDTTRVGRASEEKVRAFAAKWAAELDRIIGGEPSGDNGRADVAD